MQIKRAKLNAKREKFRKKNQSKNQSPIMSNKFKKYKTCLLKTLLLNFHYPSERSRPVTYQMLMDLTLSTTLDINLDLDCIEFYHLNIFQLNVSPSPELLFHSQSQSMIVYYKIA